MLLIRIPNVRYERNFKCQLVLNFKHLKSATGNTILVMTNVIASKLLCIHKKMIIPLGCRSVIEISTLAYSRIEGLRLE